MHMHELDCLGQDRFEERWKISVVPKLLEEGGAHAADVAASQRRVANGLRAQAAEALAAASAAYAGYFARLEHEIIEAKTVAAAACLPLPVHEQVTPCCKTGVAQ